MIFTTNRPFERGGRVLHDEDLAQGILDRVLDRGRVFSLDGPSVRRKRLTGGANTRRIIALGDSR